MEASKLSVIVTDILKRSKGNLLEKREEKKSVDITDRDKYDKIRRRGPADRKVRSSLKLSPEESEALGILHMMEKESSTFDPSPEADLNRIKVLRYVDDLDPNAALNYLNEFNPWLKKYNLNSLKASDSTILRELKSNKFRWIEGKEDLQGRALIVSNPGNHNTSTSTPEEVLALVVFIFDKILENEAYQKKGVTIISDGSTAINPSFLDRKLATLLLEAFNEKYPIKIENILLYNSPWWYKIFYKLIRRTMRPSLASKVKIVSSPKELENYVASDQLPTELGGDYDYNHTEWIEKIIVNA